MKVAEMYLGREYIGATKAAGSGGLVHWEGGRDGGAPLRQSVDPRRGSAKPAARPPRVGDLRCSAALPGRISPVRPGLRPGWAFVGLPSPPGGWPAADRAASKDRKIRIRVQRVQGWPRAGVVSQGGG